MTVTTRSRFKVLENLPKIEGVRFKHLEDKKVVVYENGRVFRVLENGYDEPNQHRLVPRGRRNVRYRLVTVNVTENGKRKQKRYYVHRLVGKAFIPNPENKPQINHIDGNGENNHVSNLEWVTAKENTAHAFKLGLINTLDTTNNRCDRCEDNPVISARFCVSCKTEFENLKGRLNTIQNRRNEVRNIDTKLFKERYKTIVRMRYRGQTLEQIGDHFGFSRERARQLLEEIKEDNEKIYKTGKLLADTLQTKGTTEEKYTNNFKVSLKAARVNANYLLGDIADELGVTPSTVGNWENGKTKIPNNQFEKMLDLYKTPIMYVKVLPARKWVQAIN